MGEKLDSIISEMNIYDRKHRDMSSRNYIGELLISINTEFYFYGLLSNSRIIDFKKVKNYLNEYEGLEEFTLKLLKSYIRLNDKLDDYEQIVEKTETICSVINQYRKLKTIARLDDVKVNKFTIVDDLNRIMSTAENSLSEKNLRIAELEDEVSRLKWRCDTLTSRLDGIEL